jgi:hypothetical protein
MSRDRAWSAVSWVFGFTTFVGVTVIAQFLALEAYESWWASTDAAGQPIPSDTIEFIKWFVGGGVGLLAAKVVGDNV